MFRTILGLALAVAGCLSASAQAPSSPDPQAPSQYRAVLNRYCITCHNEKLKTAGLILSQMDIANVPAGAEVWEKVIRKLRSGQMPPPGIPRPDKGTSDSFAAYLEMELDRAAEARPNPGKLAAVHRLNRSEYANAVRDLVGIEIDERSMLPADNAAHGFDNIADVLAVSPVLFERYLTAAEQISRLAIGDPGIPPELKEFDLPDSLRQNDRMSDGLPFGSRGGIAIRHYFPVDGKYVIQVRLQRDNLGKIVGNYGPKHLDIRLDGARVKLFQVGDEHNGGKDYELTADAGLEVRFPAKAGSRLVGVTFLKDTLKPEGIPRDGGYRRTVAFEGVGRVTIAGPYNATGPGETVSRGKIFVCRPAAIADEEACARKILHNLARRAYRRPVTGQDTQPLLSLYRAGRSKAGFEVGIRMALEGMLVSPGFLFRTERDPANVAPDTAYRISSVELASRLSFFLWSSIPDDELLEIAERGGLKDPAVLEQQVQRMLRDSRSQALVSNFAGQWLFLRNMRTKTPDLAVFANFDDNLRKAFIKETELFFESIVRENRSVLDLLNADYTFLNERLARHYGIAKVYGSHFRRVTLNNVNRKGLLGQGSILTVTSYATRTAPTLRGKWLLENILGTPPPPPPPDVPSLKEDEHAKALTMRQRMEQHSANPTCASCHRIMDPLGFALENFDAIGRWRTVEADTPIDASGVLPDGTQFQGPAELREILLSRRDEFVHTLTEKLFTYAMGRPVNYYDIPVIRKITREAAPTEYRWSSLIEGIVSSPAFQMRRSQQP